jgi:hypothetical protein
MNFFKRKKSGIFAPELMLRKKDAIEEHFGIRGEVAVLVLDRETDILKRKIGGGNTIMGQLLMMYAQIALNYNSSYTSKISLPPLIGTTDIAPFNAAGVDVGGGVGHCGTEPIFDEAGGDCIDDDVPLSNLYVVMSTINDPSDPGGTGCVKYAQWLGVLDEGAAYNKTGYLILGKIHISNVGDATNGGTGQMVAWAKYAQNINITSAEKVHVHWKISFA